MTNNYFKVMTRAGAVFFFFGSSRKSEHTAYTAALALALQRPGAPSISVWRETKTSWPIFRIGDTGDDAYKLDSRRHPVGRQLRISLAFLKRKGAA